MQAKHFPGLRKLYFSAIASFCLALMAWTETWVGAGPSCDPKGAGMAVSCCALLGNEVSPLEHSRYWQFEESRMGPFFLPKHVKGYFGDIILFVLLDIPFPLCSTVPSHSYW